MANQNILSPNRNCVRIGVFTLFCFRICNEDEQRICNISSKTSNNEDGGFEKFVKEFENGLNKNKEDDLKQSEKVKENTEEGKTSVNLTIVAEPIKTKEVETSRFDVITLSKSEPIIENIGDPHAKPSQDDLARPDSTPSRGSVKNLIKVFQNSK